MSDLALGGDAAASTPSPPPSASAEPAPGVTGAQDAAAPGGESASAEPAAPPSHALQFSLPGLLADREESGPGAEPPSAEGGQPPAAPAQRFRFADQEYDTPAQAEQAFRSLQGQFKPLQTRAQQAETSVREWVEYANQLEAKLAAAAGGPTGQQPAAGKAEPQSAAPAPTPDPVEAVDMEFFGQMVEDHGLTVATAWLVPQIAKAIEAKVEQRLTDMVGPLQAQANQQQTLTRVNTLWSQVAGQRNAAGQPLYPELQDDRTAQEVAYIWTKMGLTPEMAMSPTGVHLAVLAHRDWMATSNPSPAPTPANPAVPNPTQVSLAAQAAVASGNGAPPAARPVEGNSEAAHELSIRRAIMAAGDRRGILGFTE